MQNVRLFPVVLVALALVRAVPAAPLSSANLPAPSHPVKVLRDASGQIDFFNTKAERDGSADSSSQNESIRPLYPSARTDDAILTGTYTLSPFSRSGGVKPALVASKPAASPEPPSLLLLGSGILCLAIAARRRFRAAH